MSHTFSFTSACRVNGVEAASSTFTATGTGLGQIVETIPATSSRIATLSIDVSKLAGLYILATGGALLFSTDPTSGAGDENDPLTLADGVPIVWTSDSGLPNPLTVDAGVVNIENEAASAVTFTMAIVYDATP